MKRALGISISAPPALTSTDCPKKIGASTSGFAEQEKILAGIFASLRWCILRSSITLLPQRYLCLTQPLEDYIIFSVYGILFLIKYMHIHKVELHGTKNGPKVVVN